MIKTWRQRCEEHPDHNGIVTERMIQARMQEEIDELRAAIEQAQGKHEDWCASLTQLLLSMPPKPAPCNCKSKTASPRRWQKLTDEEIWSDGSTMDLSEDGIRNFARAIEAKLKEKNHG